MRKTVFGFLIVSLLTGCATPTPGPTPTEAATKAPEQAILSMDNYTDSIDSLQIQSLVQDWSHTYRVMAHALGGIDGYDYTNSLNAFVANYNQGTKLFEFDLEHTLEGDLVLAHTWEDFKEMLPENTDTDPYAPMSLEEFQSSRIYGLYTPMTFDDLLQVMQELPDFYVIVDSKTFDVLSTNEIYTQMIDQINAINPELIHRFVPQAYTPEIYDTITSFGFDQVIFTLYHYYADSDGQQIYQFIKERSVPVVVMHMDNDWAIKVITDIYAYAKQDGKENDFSIYIHTVNDMEVTKKIFEEYHFFGIYSDFITEKQIEEAF